MTSRLGRLSPTFDSARALVGAVALAFALSACEEAASEVAGAPEVIGQELPQGDGITGVSDVPEGSDIPHSDDATDPEKDAATGCEFAGDPAPRQPGATCAADADCDSGACVTTASGRVCTTACTDCCPSGFTCESVSAVDDSRLCIPAHGTLCRP